MAVILLDLSAPLQSWGCQSRYARRTTRSEPTKSGVVGLIANAQGRTRDADLTDLAQLEMAVRIDQEGVPLRDFHTARPEGRKPLPLSDRFYLADARFTVALATSSETTAKAIAGAIAAPARPLFLGRRSCPPSDPPLLALLADEVDPRAVLETFPWRASAWYRRRHGDRPLRIVADARDGEVGAFVDDMPVSFSEAGRTYARREVIEYTIAPLDSEHAPIPDPFDCL